MKKLQREFYQKELEALRSARPNKWLASSPIHRVVRFGVVAAQTETDFTVNNVLYALCCASSTTFVNSLAYATKLKRVRIWFTSPTVGTAISSTIEWNAAATGFLVNGSSVSEVNASTTDMVCLEARPPSSTLASWYQGGATAGTNVLFSFSAPAGAVMEIEYDYVLNTTEALVGSLGVTGATPGTVYCKAINANVLALPPLNSIV